MQEKMSGEKKSGSKSTAAAVKSLTATGKSLVTTTSALTKLSKTLSSVSDSSKKTAKALRTLLRFDEINKLSKAASQKSKSSGSKGKSGAKNPKKELSAVEKTLKKLFSLKSWSAIKGFKEMQAAAGQLSDRLKKGLLWGYENVLVPLSKWGIKEGLPAAMRVLIGAIDLLCGALDVLAPIARTVWEVFFVPVASWAGDVVVSVLNRLGTSLEIAANGLKSLALLMNDGGPLAKLGETIKSVFSGGLLTALKDLGGRISGWFNEHVMEPLKKTNPKVSLGLKFPFAAVEEAWENLKQRWGDSRAVQALVKLAKSGWSTVTGWIGNLPAVANGVKLVKSGWATVSGWMGKLNPVSLGIKLVKSGWSSVKEWLGELSAKFNIKLPKVEVTWSGSPIQLPHFHVQWNAKGGILTGATLFGMAGSTLLGGGEAGREAVLPLERNTGWMDTLAQRVADRTVQQEQAITVQVMLDGRIVGESVVKYVNGQARATGVHPMAAYL